MSKTFKHLKRGDVVWKIINDDGKIIPLRVDNITITGHFYIFRIVYPKKHFCFEISEKFSRPKNYFLIFLNKHVLDISYHYGSGVAVDKSYLK